MKKLKLDGEMREGVVFVLTKMSSRLGEGSIMGVFAYARYLLHRRDVSIFDESQNLRHYENTR